MGLGSTSHCQPSACEKTKTSFPFSRKNIAVDYLKKNDYNMSAWPYKFSYALTKIDIQFQRLKFNGPKPALSFFEKIFLLIEIPLILTLPWCYNPSEMSL